MVTNKKLTAKMRFFITVLLGLVAAASAFPRNSQRIIGGTETTINQYPEMASLLFLIRANTFLHSCGSIIINNRSVLTAAHCTHGTAVNMWRIRVGSTFTSSGGVAHSANRIFNHPQYCLRSLDNDIAIVRTRAEIMFNPVVRAGRLAGPNYNVPNNAVVWAAGWGFTSNGPGAQPSEVLRHVQVWYVNQQECRRRYASSAMSITENMLCSGWLDVGGRGQCSRDSGGPLYHNGVVVGVTSFGDGGCGHPFFPVVSARVSRYTAWIQNNK